MPRSPVRAPRPSHLLGSVRHHTSGGPGTTSSGAPGAEQVSGSRPGVKGPDSGQTPLGHSPVTHGQSAPAPPPPPPWEGKGRASHTLQLHSRPVAEHRGSKSLGASDHCHPAGGFRVSLLLSPPGAQCESHHLPGVRVVPSPLQPQRKGGLRRPWCRRDRLSAPGPDLRPALRVTDPEAGPGS